MSPDLEKSFVRQWPAVERRLRLLMGAKKVRTSDAEDLVQETATRLLTVWHKVDRNRDPWPLALTIALNLVRDRGRRSGREILGELPEIPVPLTAEEAGIARLELRRVLLAMADLTAAQRQALIEGLERDAGSAALSSSTKMLRLRARRRLANALGRASAGVTLRARRLADSLFGALWRGDPLAPSLACLTCLFVGASGIGTVIDAGTFEAWSGKVSRVGSSAAISSVTHSGTTRPLRLARTDVAGRDEGLVPVGSRDPAGKVGDPRQPKGPSTSPGPIPGSPPSIPLPGLPEAGGGDRDGTSPPPIEKPGAVTVAKPQEATPGPPPLNVLPETTAAEEAGELIDEL